ncbi:aminodeoxychorismate synthase component I [Azospirillum sp. HJ39]|uniref:aminodeoxychorismate synthase component I n=1 Tax=Azospirillum sp. HJ39 TaxID=3159496 RepID=UPI003557BBB3
MLTIPVSCGGPAAAFRPWSAEPWAMLLDSAAAHPQNGRYSYIVAEPFQTIEAIGGRTLVDGAAVAGSPFDALERALAAHPLPRSLPSAGPVPFTGGAVGFIGYEAGMSLEGLRSRHPNPGGQPDMAFGLYDVVAAFDRQERRAWVVAARPEAEERARRMAARLSVPPPEQSAGPAPLSWRSELSRPGYLDRVGRVLDYIRAGDIYQANFTQRFLADVDGTVDAYALYERLRVLSPAPFAAFLNCGPRLRLAGASPERFIRLGADRTIETRPIKGTRPRPPNPGADPAADAAAAAELSASVKDRAENLMITDLLRNDLGRVSEIGSVRVPVLYGLESFASVHHLVSVVTSRLRPGLGPVDLLRAACPGGSITGAPKIRAMQIIDELEVSRRGAYCGTVAWIGFDRAMDSNIVIRTLSVTPDAVIAQAGGGIVADSDPAAEHEEMLVKARAQLRAVGELAGEGTA